MIRVSGLKKYYPTKHGAFHALADLDLEVAAKEFFVLLGPSGSGKTTLLRCVAGIETPSEGEIVLGDRLVFSSRRGIFVPPEDRALGMVFQSYAVWPHLTVYQNVALPLLHGTRRIEKRQVRDRVMHALSLVQMEALADRPVPFLSGGQQQRVALARALAVRPVVLLMDEPLSNLDARLREDVRRQIKHVTATVGVTVLYVTHDQAEAAALADRIAVMSEGHILQIATPDRLYRQPARPQVADFLGRVNWLKGMVKERDRIETEIGTIEASTREMIGAVRVGVRPADIMLSARSSGQSNEFCGRVVQETFLGEHVAVQVELHPGVLIEVQLGTRAQGSWQGRDVYSSLRTEDIVVFPDA